jgi:hypothetical protein
MIKKNLQRRHWLLLEGCIACTLISLLDELLDIFQLTLKSYVILISITQLISLELSFKFMP